MAGLYIHIPYCHAKCAYCDFYSTPDSTTSRLYVEAILKELELRLPELDKEPIKTLYIGGGTPSALPVEYMELLLTGLQNSLNFSLLQEFTVEVNPEDVNPILLSRLQSHAVNRISMGVQSLNDAELQAVGRRHSASEALLAIEMIKSLYDNYSLDIIFGLPGQTLDSLSHTIDTLLTFNPPHLSTYLLSYEPGTRLYAGLMAGKIEEVPDDVAENMYQLVNDKLGSSGYSHYEISNHALPGRYSRHNSSYWDMTPYLGIGASAHSYISGRRTFNPSSIKRYIDAIKAGKTCYIIDDETPEQRFNDWLIVSLRTARGLDLKALDKWPDDIRTIFFRQLDGVIDRNEVVRTKDRIVINPSRWLTADNVLRQLIIV